MSRPQEPIKLNSFNPIRIERPTCCYLSTPVEVQPPSVCVQIHKIFSD